MKLKAKLNLRIKKIKIKHKSDGEEIMRLQVLLSTMKRNNLDILNKMKIQTDTIIINQTDQNKIDEFEWNKNKIKFFSLNERGIGLSRNTALMRANADIVLFADDDVEYLNNYEEIILKEFQENKDADIIIFNVLSESKERPEYVIKKNKKLNYFNCMRYGTFRIAAKLERIKEKNIYFSLLFGGGAKYSCGEDTLFLVEALRKGLKVYSNNKIIGYVNHEVSSWFEGYNKRYFFDKGVFYYFLSKKYWMILGLQFCIRKLKLYKDEITFNEAISEIFKGAEDAKQRSKK